MAIKDIIATLNKYNPDQEVICQVVGEKAGAWNMYLSITKPENFSFVVLSLTHPELKYLPTNCSEPTQWFQCDKGHTFVALPNHPIVMGRKLCPHCAAEGGVIIS